MTVKEWWFTVDRVEEGWAVLIPRDDGQVSIQWPVRYLPAGAGEGKIIRLHMEVDEEATAEARQRIRGLIDELIRRDRKDGR